MTSEITELRSPELFVDEQVRGPFHSFRHEHRSVAFPGGTTMVDHVHFVAPLGALGRAVEAAVLGRYLRKLIHRQKRISQVDPRNRAVCPGPDDSHQSAGSDHPLRSRPRPARRLLAAGLSLIRVAQTSSWDTFTVGMTDGELSAYRVPLEAALGHRGSAANSTELRERTAMTQVTQEGALLQRIIDFYLGSGDFNGMPVDRLRNRHVVPAACRLVRKGLVEVITSDDYMNPHIRPWPCRRPVEEQIADLRNASNVEYALCLYPTSAALAERLDPQLFRDRPYNRRMAEGGTTLGLAYFRMDVLETYREDPRFEFKFHDFGFDFNITDELYQDEAEPDAEKVSLLHGGFGFNRDHTVIERVVAVFLCDLKGFTPEIQQRWRTFELANQAVYEPHPVWWGSQMGNCPDGAGPFARFFGERRALNEIFVSAFGVELFRTAEAPREFGWLLRPTGREYGRFVHDLDKLLSDDMQDKALAAAGAPESDSNGQKMGTLNRFESLLERSRFPVQQRKRVLRPFRTVRSERMRPAHSIVSNHADPTIVADQIEIINEVAVSLWALRTFFQTHPKGKTVEVDSYLDSDKSYRM